MKNGGKYGEDNADVNKLVKSLFAHLFKEVTNITTGGSETEQSKFEGPFCTFTRDLTSKKGDFSSEFDKIIEHKNNDTTLKQIPIDNHTVQASKGKVFG